MVAGTISLFRGPRLNKAEIGGKIEPTREVTLISARDSASNDEAVLLDPTPLFLPTKWNATQRSIAPREAGGKFQGYDTPKWSFRENELKLGLPSPIAVPEGIAEAVVSDASGVPLVGIGHAGSPVASPEARKGFVNVVAARSGRTIWKTIVKENIPPSGAWQPLEFFAAVDPAGLIGPLVLTSRSGNDEVDGFFAGYLSRSLRLGSQLAPGFYRITVGP